MGGITYSEICCIRNIGKLLSKNFKILTTDITNMNSFIDDITND